MILHTFFEEFSELDETIFSILNKVVHLLKDSILIFYQFAFEFLIERFKLRHFL
jgi:hypothetical protein